MTEPIAVEVFADVVCPWCFIGVKRLERALASLADIAPERTVARRWQPFQLRPEMPAGGRDWGTFAEEKFGGPTRAHEAFAQVSALGESEGIVFRFDRVASAPNTLDAHRLILLARTQGKEWAMAERLFRGYFEEGHDLNRLEHLVSMAKGVGLEAKGVEAYLQGDENREAVWESQRAAEGYGVSGVPFYIVGNEGGERYAVSGAQPVAVFLDAFRRILANA